MVHPKQREVEKKTEEIRKHPFSFKGKIVPLLGVIIFGFVGYFIVKTGGIPLILSLNINEIFILLGIELAVVVISTIKWEYIIIKHDNINFRTLFPITSAGILINNIAPGAGMGGEPLRAYYISKENEKEMEENMASVIVDQMVNKIVFFVLAGFSAVYLLFFVKIPIISFTLGIISSILFFMTVTSLFVWHHTKSKIGKKIDQLIDWAYHFKPFKILRSKFTSSEDLEKELNDYLKDFKENATIILEKPVDFLINGGFSILMYFLMFFKLFWIFNILGNPISMLNAWLIRTTALFISFFLIIPGAVEGLEYAVMSGLGIPVAASGAAILLDRITFYAVNYLGGYLSLQWLNKTSGQLHKHCNL